MSESETARASERARLADALHDDLLPLLALLRQDVADGLSDDPVVGRVDEIIAATRRLIADEHPSTAGRFEVAAAIVAVAQPISGRAGLRLLCDLDAVDDIPPVHHALVLAGVRETVTNAASHARARTVRISAEVGDAG